MRRQFLKDDCDYIMDTNKLMIDIKKIKEYHENDNCFQLHDIVKIRIYINIYLS